MNKILVFVLILLFNQISVAQSVWQQEGGDLTGDEAGDDFGTSISICNNGSAIAIGASQANGGGIVRVFENLTGTWVQRGEDITAGIYPEQIGRSISLNHNGTMIAVGVPSKSNTDTLCGAIRIYHYVSNHWIQLGNDIDGLKPNDYFGSVVSLSSNDNIVAGSSIRNDSNGIDAGLVSVYRYESGTWVQMGAPILGDTTGDNCGYSISLNSMGTILAVGLPHNSSTVQRAGRVRIYQYEGSDWVQVGTDIVGASEMDEIGSSVSISADGITVALSAFEYSSHADVFKYISENWVQLGNSIVQDSSAFGNSDFIVNLSADATTLAVSNPMFDPTGLHNSGQTSIYKFSSGNWTQIGNSINGDSSYMYFGSNISMSSDGTHIAVSAPGFGAGIVRVYRLSQVSLPDLTKQKSVFLFPNPTSEKLFIKTDIDFIGAAFFVSNSNGKIIYKGTISDENMDLPVDKFSPGIYCFSVAGKREILLKFVVY